MSARAAHVRAGAPRTGAPAVVHAAGQGVVEFGLILALGAAVAVAVLVLFRPQLAFVLSLIGSEVEKSGRLLAPLVPA